MHAEAWSDLAPVGRLLSRLSRQCPGAKLKEVCAALMQTRRSHLSSRVRSVPRESAAGLLGALKGLLLLGETAATQFDRLIETDFRSQPGMVPGSQSEGEDLVVVPGGYLIRRAKPIGED